MLLSYEKYVEFGGNLPENKFSEYEKISESELYNIANGALPTSETVETCMLIMINAYQQSDGMISKGIATSYSNDGVSVSYSQSETPESILDIARKRCEMLFGNDGVYRFLGVRHRE